MRRRILLGVSAAAVVILVALVVAIATRPAAKDPEPEASPSDWSSLPRDPAPEPAETAEPGAKGGDGSTFVLPFVAAEAASRSDRTRSVDFSEIATGAAAEDLTVGAQESFENGIVQTGTPTLVAATVTKRDDDADPPTLTVKVCLDYTKVKLQAPDGTSIKDDGAEQRVASIFVLNRIDEKWLVSSRSFPNNPSC